MQKVVIIGSGFGGLGAACLLSKAGYQVTVLEKNEQFGGRAGLFEADGFRFDMGPSWYLMPDVFERFFGLLGEDIHDHIKLTKLSPSYRVYFKDTDISVDMTGDLAHDTQTFESLETGAGQRLEQYLVRSKYVYETAIDKFLYKNYDSIRDFVTPSLLRESRKLNLLSNMDRYVRSYFTRQELQKIMEYPLVFLGSSPYNAPALYNLLSHVDFNQGVFYPQGGIYTLTEALVTVAKKHGATLRTDSEVTHIDVSNGQASGVTLANGETIQADIVVSDADIYHTEQVLLEAEYREYSQAYWEKRTLAPSALLMYLGVKGSYPQLLHHTLMFSKDWPTNFKQIFDTPQWPTDPSLYISNPSKTDPTVAPQGHENMFVLVPIASGLSYTDEELEKYADTVLQTLESHVGLKDLRKNIIYKRLFCVDDFTTRYNSFQGTGLGLAHTLRQTAIFRPKNYSKKVKDLYYVGANVHPGIGMPVTLISAELLYKRLKGDKSRSPLTSL